MYRLDKERLDKASNTIPLFVFLKLVTARGLGTFQDGGLLPDGSYAVRRHGEEDHVAHHQHKDRDEEIHQVAQPVCEECIRALVDSGIIQIINSIFDINIGEYKDTIL